MRAPPCTRQGMIPLETPNSFALDDLGHRHAEPVLHEDHLAAGDQAVVDVDVDGLADLAVEFEHRARPERSRSPIGIRAAPSTAETITGTSNSCSRSAAVLGAVGASRIESGAKIAVAVAELGR